MTEITELLERVKVATGPDRELDEAILKHLGFHSWAGRMSYRQAPIWIDFGSSEITTSIDAALALAKRCLPGWWWLREDGRSIRLVGPDNGDYYPSAIGRHHLVPLAIISALLTALIAQAEP